MSVLLDLVIVAGAAWFWPHCARPALETTGADPTTRRTVLGVTALTVVAFALAAFADLTAIGGTAVWWATTVVGAAWALIVGVGYLQNYAFLRGLIRRVR